MRIRLFGAAGEVTGSCYLLETDRARVCIEFGLHQGGVKAEHRNRRMPPIRPRELDAVILTHAHLDHSGRLPLLAREGFSGPIYATPATIDLCDILLKDAASVQAQDVERLSRKRLRRGGRIPQPLYTSLEVGKILPQLAPLPYDQPREVAPGITARFVDAGHILGSASLELTVTEGGGGGSAGAGGAKTLVFSGDIGPRGAPLLQDPVTFARADMVFLESTYGDRDHRPQETTVEELLGVLSQARRDGGKVLIPAFAVGRTQQLIWHIGEALRDGRLDHAKVILDSPMAISATELYRRHRDLFDDESWAVIAAGDTPLSFPGLQVSRTHEESMAINRIDGGVVVISASGMMTGGRILHQLKHNLWREQTHLVIVGFQAEGTLGRRIVDGAQVVQVMGEPIRVKAQLHTLGGFSAHAGQTELVQWLGAMAASPPPPRVYLTHGENGPRRALAERIGRELGLEAGMPEYGDVIEV
jgi:metallo-beta-lactamase family protein